MSEQAKPATSSRVLIVDDNLELGYMLKMSVETIGLLSCQVFSGNQALAALRETVPDLILLDVNMPDGNGLDLLQTLRAPPRWRSIRVILLTGNVQVLEHPETDLADEVLIKPIHIPDLLKTIQRLLR